MPSFDATAAKPTAYRAVALLALATLATLSLRGGQVRAQAPELSWAAMCERLKALHHSDEHYGASAEAQLRAAGLTAGQVEHGRLIYHPRDEVRMQAASRFSRGSSPWESMCLVELTRDANAKVRMSALEAVQKATPNPVLHHRLEEMSDGDPDALVRGLARLVSAEWAARIPGPGAVLASGPTLGQASPALMPSQGTMPPTTTPRTPMLPATLPPATRSSPAGQGEAVPAPGKSPSPEEVLPPPASPRGGGPDILRRPLEETLPEGTRTPGGFIEGPLLQTEVDAPLGFTGRSSVMPTEIQQDSHFVPVEDRWRIGLPEWDRYGRGFPLGDDYPYAEGAKTDPYNQNVLKGDYPIFGQHTFFNLTATSLMLHEQREVPTPTTPFESTVDPFQEEFFGRPDQYFYNHNLLLSLELFHGDAAFKPVDWRLRIAPVFNVNYLDVEELAIVNPDVRRGTTRGRNYLAAEQWFAEAKLADFGPDYDFLSVRVGSQLFVSDFRGFVFSDVNRAVRLFGTRWSNRHQFNLVYFDQREKDTNSELNTWTDDRHQNTLIANYFIQDFVFPGYTFMVNFHYNRDKPSMKFDRNDFLVRPDAAGVFQPHNIEAYYLGVHGDGHIGRYNVSNAFYWVLGSDSLNPIAGTPQDINAQMAAIELSVRSRLYPFPHVVLLVLRRQECLRRPGGGVRHDLRCTELRRWRVQLLAAASRAAVRRQPGESQEPRARSALQQNPGPEQFREPRPVPAQPGLRRRYHAEATDDPQHELPLVRADRRAGAVHVSRQHPPRAGHGHELRLRVSPAAQ